MLALFFKLFSTLHFLQTEDLKQKKTGGNRRKQKDLTRKQVTLKRAPSERFSKNSKSYLRNMNCISLCQRADYVLNVGRMDTPHIQTHYDDKQTHLWIIIKTHVGSFKRDIHTYRHIMGTLSRHTRGQSKETDISTTHVSVMRRSAGGTQQTHTPLLPT